LFSTFSLFATADATADAITGGTVNNLDFVVKKKDGFTVSGLSAASSLGLSADNVLVLGADNVLGGKMDGFIEKFISES